MVYKCKLAIINVLIVRRLSRSAVARGQSNQINKAISRPANTTPDKSIDQSPISKPRTRLVVMWPRQNMMPTSVSLICVVVAS